MSDLPDNFYQPRNGPSTVDKEILASPYTPSWATSRFNRQQAQDAGEPTQIPAGQEIQKETHRSCSYSSPAMLELLPNGCAWYQATETCETITTITWLNWTPGQDKVMDTRSADHVATTVYLLVCPDGSVTPSTATGPKRFLIPDEMAGAVSNSYTLPGGGVRDETQFWKFQPPAVDRDECIVVATYLLMVRISTVAAVGGALTKVSDTEFVPRTTQEFTFNKCTAPGADDVPGPSTAPSPGEDGGASPR